MGTNFDRVTDRSDRATDDCTETRRDDPHEPPRRDAEAARRSFEADERAAEAERTPNRGRGRSDSDWNAVGLVTSLGATCLFGVSGVLARSSQLATAASVTFVAVGVLLAQRGRRRLG